MTDPFVNTEQILAELTPEQFRFVFEKVEREKRNRTRGNHNVQFRRDPVSWEKRTI